MGSASRLGRDVCRVCQTYPNAYLYNGYGLILFHPIGASMAENWTAKQTTRNLTRVFVIESLFTTSHFHFFFWSHYLRKLLQLDKMSALHILWADLLETVEAASGSLCERRTTSCWQCPGATTTMIQPSTMTRLMLVVLMIITPLKGDFWRCCSGKKKESPFLSSPSASIHKGIYFSFFPHNIAEEMSFGFLIIVAGGWPWRKAPLQSDLHPCVHLFRPTQYPS